MADEKSIYIVIDIFEDRIVSVSPFPSLDKAQDKMRFLFKEYIGKRLTKELEEEVFGDGFSYWEKDGDSSGSVNLVPSKLNNKEAPNG